MLFAQDAKPVVDDEYPYIPQYLAFEFAGEIDPEEFEGCPKSDN